MWWAGALSCNAFGILVSFNIFNNFRFTEKCDITTKSYNISHPQFLLLISYIFIMFVTLNELTSIHYYSLKSMLYADFLVLPHVVFLCHNTTLHLVVLPGIHFFWEEDPRGKVPFSSHNIKEEDYHDLSLWMLTLITRLRYYLSGFSLSIPDSLEGSHYANPALAE